MTVSSGLERVLLLPTSFFLLPLPPAADRSTPALPQLSDSTTADIYSTAVTPRTPIALHQELIQLLDSLGWAKPSRPALDLHKEKDRLRRKALIVQSKPPLTAAYSVTRAFDAFS